MGSSTRRTRQEPSSAQQSDAAIGRPLRTMTGIGPVRPDTLPAGVEWHDSGHPIPDARSVTAARRALAIAAAASERDLLVVLLSGGTSALMALPAEGVTLEDKQDTVRQLLKSGATIDELNAVRKHLSAIKGGRLAAATVAPVVTLVISDVVGDDLSVIGSGPTMPDPSTFAEANCALRSSQLEFCNPLSQPESIELIDGKHSYATVRATWSAGEPLPASACGIGQCGVHDLNQSLVSGR